MSDNYLKQVRAQYEDYPYPPMNPQDEKKRLLVPYPEGFPYIGHYCFSGKKDPRENCRYLVAGGGTGDAAIALAEQLREHPSSTVTYVDISQASQKVARERARLRGLEDRIEWHHGSLLDVKKMGIGEFDYINSSGVLHHLADPKAGLNALVSVLKTDGVLSLMLYAKYGRLAVYQMQEALRLLNKGIEDQQEKVESTKVILDALPNSNWLFNSPPVIISEVQGGDIAIYDLLLHSQDRAYSIPELYDFLDNSGLKLIQLFSDDFTQGKKLYTPEYYIRDEKLLARAKALPVPEQQALAELLNGKICKHTFYAAPKMPAPPSLNDPEMVPFFDCSFVPGIYEACVQLVQQSNDVVVMKSQATVAAFPKTPNLLTIVKHVDGMRSLGEIHTLAVPSLSYDAFVKEFSIMYDALNEYHWMLLRHKSIPPYPERKQLQERLKNYV